MQTVMKRLLTAAAAVFITALTAHGQDILVMTDGSNIEALVSEVASSYVKYKMFDYLDGPVFTVEKDRISHIRYQNGSIDVFKEQERPEESSAEANRQHRLQDASDPAAAKPEDNRFRFGIHAGVAQPVGTFNDQTGTSLLIDNGLGGGAGTGATFGAKFLFGIRKVKGLSVVADIDFVINPLKQDVKNIFDYAFSSTSTYVMDKYPVYVSVPITSGLNYRYNFNKTFGLWGEASVGFNMRFISSMTMLNTEESEYLYTDEDGIRRYSSDEDILSYNPNIQFAYQAGCGIILWDRFTVGFHYNGNNRSKISGTSIARVYKDNVKDGRDKMTMGKTGYSCFLIRLGFLF